MTERRSCRLVVVGSGPAGVAAAVEARRAGLETCLVEQRPALHAPRRLLAQLEASGAEVLVETAAWGIWGRDLALCGPHARSSLLTFDQLIVATGSFARTVAFPGWSLPGVTTVEGAHPGQNVVVAGYGSPLAAAIQTLEARGIQARATLDASGRRGRLPLRAEGDERLERLISMAVDDDWHMRPGTEQTISADTLVLAFGSAPEDRLLRLAGCAFSGSAYIDPYTLRDPWMRTSVAGVLVAGDAGGIVSADAAVDQGRLAGLAAAMYAGCIDAGDAERRARPVLRRLSQLSPLDPPREALFLLAEADTVICRCEDVTADTITACSYPGSLEPASVIAETRATMGLCQGRNCAHLVAASLARHAGVALDQIPPVTPRPPVVPVPLGAVAERPPVFPPIPESSAAR